MPFLLLLATVGFLLVRITKPEDRERWRQRAVANAVQLRAIATRPRPEIDRFEQALRTRTGRLFVAPALVALCVLAFVLGWNASVGPKTTNGAWWLLLTATFVHTGVIQLAIHGAALFQVASTIERLAGRAALAIVFVTSGLIAALVSIAMQPVALIAGTSGAIFGLYGFFIAAVILSRRSIVADEDTRLTIPPQAIRRIALIALLLWLTNAVGGTIPLAAELAALAFGLAAGLALLRGVAERTPEPPHLAVTGAVGLIVVAALAWSVRGIADVRPEIARVLATEDRTAAAYNAAMDGVRKGKATVDGVAQLIEATIEPELEAVDARLKALKKVPPEHQPMVNDAQEFLRLRTESWRLRAASLRTAHRAPRKRPTDADVASEANWRVRLEAQFRSDRNAIGKAEAVERSSREVLARLRPAA